MKKILSVLLSFVMLVTISSTFNSVANAEVADDYSFYDLSDGTVGIEYYFGDATTLEIPSTYNGKTVTEIGPQSFRNERTLTDVIIPNTVKKIRFSSFDGCTSLKNVTIPNSVTSIEWFVFENCTSLQSVTIPDGITFINESLFENCTSLESVTLPKGITKILSGAFVKCDNLKEVYFAGTKEEWNRVDIDIYGCDILDTAIIHCSNGDMVGQSVEDNKPTGATTPSTTENNTETPSTANAVTTASVQSTASAVDYPSSISNTSSAPVYTTSVQTTTQTATVSTNYETTTTVSNNTDSATSYAVSQTTVKPKAAKFKKVKGSKKAIALTWAKVKGVKGYQIQVATDKKFKKNKKTITIKKQKTTKTTVKKLKAKKKYFVRIRTYKTKKVNGKSTKVYSAWSKVKTVKTK